MIDLSPIRARFASLSPHLDERERRLFAATEALSVGYGGIAAVARATGIAVSTIGRGLNELKGVSCPADATRVRRPGGGRKALVSASPTLLNDLLAMVEPTARGDPMSPLRWTCKGTRLRRAPGCEPPAGANSSASSASSVRDAGNGQFKPAAAMRF